MGLIYFIGTWAFIATIACSIVVYRNRNILWPKRQHSA